MLATLFRRVFSAVTIVNREKCAVCVVQEVVLIDVHILHVFPSLVCFFANPSCCCARQIKTFTWNFYLWNQRKSEKKNQSCYNLLSKDNDVTIYSLPKLFDFWKKAFVARPTAWRPKMFTPLGLRFFCNELVTTTCGKSTKLKVRFFGFQRGYRWIATWKKRANNLKFNKFLLLLLYY